MRDTWNYLHMVYPLETLSMPEWSKAVALEQRGGRRRLRVEPLPRDAWRRNLRILRADHWPVIRKFVLDSAHHRCSICGDWSWRLHAHEVWGFTPDVQWLADVVAICPDCHHVIHWGHTERTADDGTRTTADLARLRRHFCRVNGEDETAFDEAVTVGRIRMSALNCCLSASGRTVDLSWADALLESLEHGTKGY